MHRLPIHLLNILDTIRIQKYFQLQLIHLHLVEKELFDNLSSPQMDTVLCHRITLEKGEVISNVVSLDPRLPPLLLVHSNQVQIQPDRRNLHLHPHAVDFFGSKEVLVEYFDDLLLAYYFDHLNIIPPLHPQPNCLPRHLCSHPRHQCTPHRLHHPELECFQVLALSPLLGFFGPLELLLSLQLGGQVRFFEGGIGSRNELG